MCCPVFSLILFACCFVRHLDRSALGSRQQQYFRGAGCQVELPQVLQGHLAASLQRGKQVRAVAERAR